MFDFLSRKFSEVVARLTGDGHLTEANITQAVEQVREALIEADVPHELVQAFIDAVRKDAVGQKVLSTVKPGQQFVKIVYDQILAFMGGAETFEFSFQIPAVVMVVGLQGSGKTTSIAKMAHLVRKQAEARNKTRNILCASVDYYRPAAIDQLETLAQTVGAAFYRAASTKPLVAAGEIVQKFKNGGYELLFLDTAGRLHVDEAMLREIAELDALVKPKYKILVLDAMTGQESLKIAKAFDEKVSIYGAMLTKLDSDTRGGAAFAFRYAVGKPIIFVGTGEKVDDIGLFKPDRFAGRILGMGDVLSLVERAEDRVNENDRAAVERVLRSGSLTLDDFALQIKMVNSMGSLANLVQYLPGLSSTTLSQEKIEKAEHEVKCFSAAISSMTPRERKNPKIIDASRKKRIARGAGITTAVIDLLLQRFEESKQYVKLFRKLGRL